MSTTGEGGPHGPAWAIAKLHKIRDGEESEAEFPLKWATKDTRLALDALQRSNGLHFQRWVRLQQRGTKR